jgi:hypothetical protein
MNDRSGTFQLSIWVTVVIPVLLVVATGVLVPYGFGARVAAGVAALLVWEVALRVFASRREGRQP